MKKSYLLATVFFGLALLCLTLFLPLQGAENLYGSVIRIHVLANSDSKEDQERKLLLRDQILLFAKENLSENEDKEDAEKKIREKIPEIIALSEKTLKEAGKEEKVSVSLSEEYYPTRHYENLSLPSGEYLSLRVMIGEASGQNWWCVLFPPICIGSAVEEAEDALANVGMEEKNIHTVTGKKEYAYRFKILEVWEKTKESFRQLF